jgi:hypothetical protein
MRPAADCVRTMTCAVSSRLLAEVTFDRYPLQHALGLPPNARRRHAPGSPADTRGQSPPHPAYRSRHRPGDGAAGAIRVRRASAKALRPSRGIALRGPRHAFQRGVHQQRQQAGVKAAKPAARPAGRSIPTGGFPTRVQRQIVDDHHHRRPGSVRHRAKSRTRNDSSYCRPVVRQREIAHSAGPGPASLTAVDTNCWQQERPMTCPLLLKVITRRPKPRQERPRRAKRPGYRGPMLPGSRTPRSAPVSASLKEFTTSASELPRTTAPATFAADRIGAAANSVHKSRQFVQLHRSLSLVDDRASHAPSTSISGRHGSGPTAASGEPVPSGRRATSRCHSQVLQCRPIAFEVLPQQGIARRRSGTG